MNKELLHILQHSMGCDCYGQTKHHRRDDGDGCWHFHRNRFVTDHNSPDGKRCLELVAMGFMEDKGPVTFAGGMHCRGRPDRRKMHMREQPDHQSIHKMSTENENIPLAHYPPDKPESPAVDGLGESPVRNYSTLTDEELEIAAKEIFNEQLRRADDKLKAKNICPECYGTKFIGGDMDHEPCERCNCTGLYFPNEKGTNGERKTSA